VQELGDRTRGGPVICWKVSVCLGRVPVVDQGHAAAAGEAHNPAWKTIPSWFLLPTEDRVIGTDAERAVAVRAGSHIVEVRASHAVLVPRPTKVTKLIEEAAQATATS
jgi:hypothetical protein